MSASGVVARRRQCSAYVGLRINIGQVVLPADPSEIRHPGLTWTVGADISQYPTSDTLPRYHVWCRV
eukprot:5775558-Amphidinium_carterae.1